MGEEEISFLPTVMILKIGEQRAKSEGFLICARKKGGGEWLFLDSAALRKDPDMLWVLFPGLPKDIELPANAVALIE